MHELGTVNDATGICQVKYIDEGDWINKVAYQYSRIGINLLLISTNGGKSLNFGKAIAGAST